MRPAEAPPPLYPVDAPLAGITQKAESVEHLVSVEMDGKTARIQALAVDGRVIDEFPVAARSSQP